jgi:hypothetical protein
VNNPPTGLWGDRYIEDERWHTKPGYMSDLRRRGLGPRFLRLSTRVVRYRPEDVLAYEEQQGFHSIAASLASDFKAPADSNAPPVESRRKRVSQSLRKKKADRQVGGRDEWPPTIEMFPETINDAGS